MVDFKSVIDTNIPFKSNLFGIYSWPVEAMRLCKIQTLFAGHQMFPAAADCKRNWHERHLHTLSEKLSLIHTYTYIYNGISSAKRSVCKTFVNQKFFPKEQTDHVNIGYCQFYSNTFFFNFIPEC